MDKRGVPFSFFKKASFIHADKKATKEELKGQPYHIGMDKHIGHLRIDFYGYLGEPALEIPITSIK